MPYLTVDNLGNEAIFENKPIREMHIWSSYNRDYDSIIYLPKGTIKKMLSKELKWEDEPVELKE